jgi:hypothetical protein
MSRAEKRKCRHCRKIFSPEPRNVKHQRHCSQAECQQARKRKSQRRWANRPENRDYFRGPAHVERVRAWREAHPGYWRREAKVAGTLQDDCQAQATEIKEQSGENAATPLQDVLTSQPLVLIGLIAQITGITLQDDIAIAGRRLLRLGQDIVGGKRNETSAKPEPAAPGAEAI